MPLDPRTSSVQPGSHWRCLHCLVVPAGAYVPAGQEVHFVAGSSSSSVLPSGHFWHSPVKPAAAYVPRSQLNANQTGEHILVTCSVG